MMEEITDAEAKRMHVECKKACYLHLVDSDKEGEALVDLLIDASCKYKKGSKEFSRITSVAMFFWKVFAPIGAK